jgi:hypothetical protein
LSVSLPRPDRPVGDGVLEAFLNGAVQAFVHNVVTDPDLTRLLVTPH